MRIGAPVMVWESCEEVPCDVVLCVMGDRWGLVREGREALAVRGGECVVVGPGAVPDPGVSVLLETDC